MSQSSSKQLSQPLLKQPKASIAPSKADEASKRGDSKSNDAVSEPHSSKMQMKEETELTKKAADTVDWFKFETRIRRIIQELLEPSITRTKEVEQDNKKLMKKIEKIHRKAEDTEYTIDKLEKKTSGQDELFAQVRGIDQFAKLTETKVLNEMNNMTSTIELMKEKMRVEQSDVEEHIKTISKQGEQITSLHEQILQLKKTLSKQIKDETYELKDEILNVKKYFDEQKDFVTQFDSTISFLKKQTKRQKQFTDESFTKLNEEMDAFRKEQKTAEASYQKATTQLRSVFGQMMDIERRIIETIQNGQETRNYLDDRLEQFRRWLSVIQPMHTFSLVSDALQNSLLDFQLNRCIDYAREVKWPELQQRLAQYDQGVLDDRIDLRSAGTDFPPEIPDKVKPLQYTTVNQVLAMIDDKLQNVQIKRTRKVGGRPDTRAGDGEGGSSQVEDFRSSVDSRKLERQDQMSRPKEKSKMRVPSSYSRRGGSRADFRESRPTHASRSSAQSVRKDQTGSIGKTAAGDESLAVDLKGTIDEEKEIPPSIVERKKTKPIPKMSSKRHFNTKGKTSPTRNQEGSPSPRKSRVTSKEASPKARRTRQEDPKKIAKELAKKKLSTQLVHVDGEADAQSEDPTKSPARRGKHPEVSFDAQRAQKTEESDAVQKGETGDLGQEGEKLMKQKTKVNRKMSKISLAKSKISRPSQFDGEGSRKNKDSVKDSAYGLGIDEDKLREILLAYREEWKEEDELYIEDQIQMALDSFEIDKEDFLDNQMLEENEAFQGVLQKIYDIRSDIFQLREEDDKNLQYTDKKEQILRDLMKAAEVRSDKKFVDVSKQIQTMSEEFHLELETELKKRSRRDNDFQNQKEKMMASIEAFKVQQDSVMKKMLLTAEAVNSLKELFKIQSVINLQEEDDKKSVALYGQKEKSTERGRSPSPNPYDHFSSASATKALQSQNSLIHKTPAKKMRQTFHSGGRSVWGGGAAEPIDETRVLQLDRTCASCSGQNQHIVKLFKLACIQYQSQKVKYLGHSMPRDKIIRIQSELCNTIESKMRSDHDLLEILKNQQVETSMFIEESLLNTGRVKDIVKNPENYIIGQTNLPSKYQIPEKKRNLFNIQEDGTETVELEGVNQSTKKTNPVVSEKKKRPQYNKYSAEKKNYQFFINTGGSVKSAIDEKASTDEYAGNTSHNFSPNEKRSRSSQRMVRGSIATKRLEQDGGGVTTSVILPRISKGKHSAVTSAVSNKHMMAAAAHSTLTIHGQNNF